MREPEGSVKAQARRSRTTASSPPPGASRSSTSPSSASTSRRTIASPRPEPPCARAGAPEAVERAGALLGRSYPGPSSRTCSSTRGAAGARGDGDGRPRRRAIERVREQVVEHLRKPLRRRAHRNGAVRLRDERQPALVGERPPRRDALAHERGRVELLGRRRPGVRAREREQRLRPCCDSRSTSRSAAPRPAASSSSPRSRFSSRSRSAVSGVRSSCDASATNSSCERRSCPSFATVSLKTAASDRTSGGPDASGARASRSPSPTAAAASLEPAQRARDEAGEAQSDQPGGDEHGRADRREQRASSGGCARRRWTSDR